MSEFTSEAALFTSVVDVNTGWSSLPNILSGADNAATTFRQTNGWLELNAPLTPFPGGRPLLPTIVINNIEIQANWRRQGQLGSGGAVYTRDWKIGAGTPHDYPTGRNSSNTAYAVSILGGDPAYWGLSQAEAVDFANGDLDFQFRPVMVAINGSESVSYRWVKAIFQYTYTGSGVAFPVRF